MTVIDPTRRGLLGALLGLAFGWELIETLAASSPIFASSPVGGAFGEAWPAVRLVLHAIACAASLVAIGQLLNKSFRPVWPLIYGFAATTVHVLGSGLQFAAIRKADAQGAIQEESVNGLLVTIAVSGLIGIVLPMTTVSIGVKTPKTEGAPPLLPYFAGAAALIFFGAMGYRAGVAPENALAELLLTGDDDERMRAAIRLAERRPETIPALDALSQTLASDDDRLARAASVALRRSRGAGVAPAKRALAATSPIVRVRAIEVLRVIGERHLDDDAEKKLEVANALASVVGDKNKRVRAASVEGLRRLGSVGGAALVRAYADPKTSDFRGELEVVLLTLDDDSAKTAVHRRRLVDKDATVRFVAARELMRLGPKAASAAPDLVGRIVAVDEQPQVKSAAASALAAIGDDAIAPIDRALPNAKPDAAALLNFAKGKGEAPKVDSPSLIPAGANEVVFLRALVDDKRATVDQVPGLSAIVADVGALPDARALSAQALLSLGQRASAAAFVLDKARKSFDAKVAQSATNALLVVAPKMTADVAGDLASPYESRRLITARALRHTVLAREEVATSLSIALVDEASSVRAAAADSLGTFGKDAAHVLQSLERAKDDDNAHVRERANAAYALIVEGQ